MNMIEATPRNAAIQIVTTLKGAGYVAYLAGGCVRDELLGYHPKDYDVATDAKPDTVWGLFPDSRYIGEAFGVVQVRVKGFREHPVEVATFRTEWGYADGRRPANVRYTDARTDAQRRDFTINGLFEDPLAGDEDERVIDFVEGRADLKARVVRAIGDPRERFGEDYLRMLRAVRFATRLGFEIDPDTAAAIPPLADNLKQISRERIGQEVLWMLTPLTPLTSGAALDTRGVAGVDRRSGEAIRLIQSLHLDGPALDEEHADPSLGTVGNLVTAEGVGYADLLAAWMLDRHFFPQLTSSDAPAMHDSDDRGRVELLAAGVERFVEDSFDLLIKRWRGGLCLSNEHRDRLRHLIERLPVVLSWRGLGVARQKRLLADSNWPGLKALVGGLNHWPGVSGLVEVLAEQSKVLFDQGVSPGPWVNGEDLIAMGRTPGPGFRRLLEAVYDVQLDGTVTSRSEALAWLREYDSGC